MKIKFKTKSKTVKTLSFHPTRSWILCGLSNGKIEIWDYIHKYKYEEFQATKGSVRGVNFHKTLPLFVTGGDDKLVKIWNYQNKKLQFSLKGHTDIIRSVHFHSEQPWVVSSSDDMSVRIWNFQNRSCIAILVRHNNIVTHVEFHPRMNTLLSASLDGTIIIWDITGLKQKFSRNNDISVDDPDNFSMEMTPSLMGLPTDMFGPSDVEPKFILEDHEMGVNWASFHPSFPLVVSCSDDNKIKLWRLSEYKAWVAATFSGHNACVSSVVFHPKEDLILSNSEDFSLRVWNIENKNSSVVFNTKNNKHWCLDAHPTQNIFATGNDRGLVVFKLKSQKSPFCFSSENLFFYRDARILRFNFKTDIEQRMVRISKKLDISNIHSLQYNPSSEMLLIQSKQKFLLFSCLQKKLSNLQIGRSSVWVSRNKFISIHNDNIFLRNVETQETLAISITDILVNSGNKNIQDCDPSSCALFPADTGSFLLATPSQILRYDLQTKCTTGLIDAKNIRQVFWSKDNLYFALVSKNSIFIYNKKFQKKAIIIETFRIKSMIWTSSHVILYSTYDHLKYGLLNGDTAIIQTITKPVYLCFFSNSKIYYLDHNSEINFVKINETDFELKASALEKNKQKILEIVKNSKFPGKAIVMFLQQHHLSEIALHLTEIPQLRFTFAIDSGDLFMAEKFAEIINQKELWKILSKNAIEQGNIEIAERSYFRQGDGRKFLFLSAITGQMQKTQNESNSSQLFKETSLQFQVSLMTGNIEQRIQLLISSNQLIYAYLTAKTYGIEEKAKEIEELFRLKNKKIPNFFPTQKFLLKPPFVISSPKNWPLLSFESMIEKDIEIENENYNDIEIDENIFNIDENDNENIIENIIDIDENEKLIYIPPLHKEYPNENLIMNTETPGELATLGLFNESMKILNTQFGVINFSPMKKYFLSSFLGANNTLQGFPNINPIIIPQFESNILNGNHFSKQVINKQSLENLLNQALSLTTQGKFSQSLKIFQEILHQIPLVVVDEISDIKKIKKIIKMCREYIIAFKLEIEKKEKSQIDPTRSLEMICYFTHCKIQPEHLVLALRSAMFLCAKMQNYLDALVFAKRLLEFNTDIQFIQKVKKIISLCEKNKSNKYKLDYNTNNSFVICCYSLRPIYNSNSSRKCPFCGSNYFPQFDRQICSVCDLCQIGFSGANGFNILRKKKKWD